MLGAWYVPVPYFVHVNSKVILAVLAFVFGRMIFQSEIQVQLFSCMRRHISSRLVGHSLSMCVILCVHSLYKSVY